MSCLRYPSRKKQKVVRVRYTPTFYHVPIFDEAYLQNRTHMRYSDTWHSQVFENQDNVNQPQINLPQQLDKNETESQKKQRKQIDKMRLSHHTLLWYDPEKEIMLKDCQNYGRACYAKERKLIQLASCPFYYDALVEQNQVVEIKVPTFSENQEQVKEVQEPKKVKNEEKNGEIKVMEPPKKQEISRKQEKKTNPKVTSKTAEPSSQSQPRPASTKARNQPTFKMVRKQK